MEKQKFCTSTFVLIVIFCLIPVNSKYLITTSRVCYSGTVQDINVYLNDNEGPWNITAYLKITRGSIVISTVTKVFQAKAQGKLKLKIPEIIPVRSGQFNNVHLVVEGHEVGKSTTKRFEEKQALTLKKQDTIVFIQTDKPIYKPGQTIRMRVICLNPDLKPFSGKIQRVSIANPTGVRMMQWDKVDLHSGIASLEMLLSKHPVLGKWKIQAQYKDKKVTKHIEVAKYVLPKFEVVIRPPPFIAIDSKEVSGTICARYTYGQLVTGKLKIVFRLKQSWWWSSRRNEKNIIVEKNVTGCYDFTLTNKDLGLTGMKYSYYGAVLNITAVMTEEATGISQTATSTKTSIVPYRVRMNFRIGTPKHFKPGLPFYGQLHVTSPDGAPIKNEKVTITANDNTRRFLYKKEFLVTNGIVDFVIKEVPINAKYLSIDARHGSGTIFGSDFGIFNWYSTAGIHCRPWYSKSWSFLALHKLSAPLKVGATAKINFQYTLKESLFESEFVYHLMCRGKVIISGRKTFSFESTTVATPTAEPTTTAPNQLNDTVLEKTNATASTADVSTPSTPSPVKTTKRSTVSKLNKANGSIEFLVTQDMVPSCRLLVYYVRKDGETVADSMEVDIEHKLENQVRVRFSERVRRPGESVQITLEATPGSKVALAAVDKSVRLLREADDVDSEEIFEILSAQDVGPSSRYGRKKKCKARYPFWPFTRQRRSIMPYSRDVYVDASKAFYDSGLVYFSDLTIESRPCPEYDFLWRSRENGPVNGPIAVPLLSIGAGGAGGEGGAGEAGGAVFGIGGGRIMFRRTQTKKKKPVSAPPKVRKNFPETWLWTEENISNTTGQTVITAKVPDTITSWHASAFAISASSGIGITEPSVLTVFQPFFVSFTLPYSVIREEQVTIITTVFNYLTQCSTILVSLTRTKHFELSSDSDQKICVCGNEAKSVKYVITPRDLGHIPLKVTIKNVQPSLCQYPADEAPLGITDAVVRKLLVEPEGVRKEYTYSSFVCPREKDGIFSDKIKVTLPKNFVPGSVHATISAIGDLMGPSLTGLEGLLRLPTGCGEQNMVKFAPNIFIMQYLNSTRQLAGDLKDKAVGFLRTGYQRELTYKRKDGSYSAFGNRDKEGSLWLTAFVLRSFYQARQFIFIDDDEIESTTAWIHSKQLDNGCFKKHGRLFNKALKGGVSTPVTLTAYVVISLLESKTDPTNNVIVNALKCITAQKDTLTDSYSNAITAYALTLAKHPSRGEFVRRLKSQAILKDGLMHWEKSVPPVKQTEYFWLPPYYRAPSTNIEMTSYALMALVGDGTDQSAIADVLPIVRWITQQRNALGGFSSTQDTCVALQALSRYAGYVFSSSERTMIRVDVGYTNDPKFHHTFRIDDVNRLVLQRTEIPEEILPMKIPIDAFGEGCALVQADVAYHIRDVAEKPAFKLSVTVRPRIVDASALVTTEVGEELCQPLEMYICAKWLEEDVSGMAVIETKLVSGFSADEETLERLTNRFDLGLMKYEIEGNKVVLYFDEIKDLCVSFGILQTSVVKKTKPSSVTVYEYYDTDKSATEMYNITEELCFPETEEITNPETNCPFCPDEIDFDISKIQPLICKTNNVMAVRTLKDGAMRFEFLSTAEEFIAKKLEKKSVRPIEVSVPNVCRCSALTPRSKALVLIQEKKLKKKVKRVILSKTAVVLHRRKASTLQLAAALSKCL